MGSHHLAKFGGHSDSGSGDMFLIYHVILQDHVDQGPCDFLGRSAQRKVTTLAILVAIGTVIVAI